jgi:hypothetical protein
VQDGVTTVIVKIDYSELHPVKFHVSEFLGPFTECSEADTNFKDGIYDARMAEMEDHVETEADLRGICYKRIDIEFCGEVHPDP